MGDIMRRFVARTVAKTVAEEAGKSFFLFFVAPFQHSFSTKVGCECVAHMMQTLTDQEEATVVSIDGVGE